MADIIKLLPEYLANQIAAGEVVQRPASVVKELMENAVDAQSTSVQLIVKEAGKQLVQVVDNGNGMSETDARMCFERHATSKIKATEDLFCIRTMGFRGEAMASIAAVAQVELKTKSRNADIGTKLVIEGSEVITQEPAALPDGTSVSVKNLFYNVPARRNFLKTNAVEMRHILDEFQRIALANPHMAFTLTHNDTEIFQLPAVKLSQRIVGLFGNQYKEQLASCEEVTPFITVKGYIGKPEFSKKSRGEQFFFVNNRYIRSNYLNHAVLSAYEGLLPKDSHPFYVLFIEIDPQHIDINVHPTKTEIKFEDEKTVYGVVRAAVKKSLGLHNIAPSLDFDGDVNFAPIQAFNIGMPEKNEPKAPVFESRFSSAATSKPNRNQEWEKLYEPLRQPAPIRAISDFEDAPAELPKNPQPQIESTGKSKALQIHQKYILVQVKSGIMLVDQQAAQERILYEKFTQSLDRQTGSSQQLLFPQAIEFSPQDYATVLSLTEEFRALGFLFNEFGRNTIVITGIPAEVPAGNEKELFEGLVEQFKNNVADLKLDKKENLARAMAKRVASRQARQLSDLEMNALVDQLFGCQVPNYTPGGVKTLVMLELQQLQDLFQKNG